jgi:hypothetical protein
VKEGAGVIVAVDLEARPEAAGLHAEREGDADVAALVAASWTRDRQLRSFISGSRGKEE